MSGHRVQAGIWQLFNSLHLKVTVAWQTCNQAGEDGGLYPSSGAASCNILRARMDLKRKKIIKQNRDYLLSAENIL